MNKELYFLFLTLFILRVTFTALPYDSGLVNWCILSNQAATFQFAFWRLTLYLAELLLIVAVLGSSIENDPEKRLHTMKMAKLLLYIQGWYIVEYMLHYTSVWFTWEQLGLKGDGRSGLSSHIFTMLTFAYYGWK